MNRIKFLLLLFFIFFLFDCSKVGFPKKNYSMRNYEVFKIMDFIKSGHTVKNQIKDSIYINNLLSNIPSPTFDKYTFHLLFQDTLNSNYTLSFIERYYHRFPKLLNEIFMVIQENKGKMITQIIQVYKDNNVGIAGGDEEIGFLYADNKLLLETFTYLQDTCVYVKNDKICSAVYKMKNFHFQNERFDMDTLLFCDTMQYSYYTGKWKSDAYPKAVTHLINLIQKRASDSTEK